MKPNFQTYLEQTSKIINESEWDFTVTKEGNFTFAKITQNQDSIEGIIKFDRRSLGLSKKAVEELADKIIKLIEDAID